MFVRAAEVCAIPESLPLSKTTYLKLLSFCHDLSLYMPLALFIIVCHTDLRIIPCAVFVKTFSARASVPSANRRSVVFAAYSNLSIMFFHSITHDLFEKNIEEGG